MKWLPIWCDNLVWLTDIPWFYGIFNAFSLSLVCVQKPFCINFYVSFSLFAGNLSKDERESFWARNAEKYHLRSLWRSFMAVMVRRWNRSEAAEGRWGSLTKCGVTKYMTDHHIHDSLSWWFVMKIREVVQYPNSKSLSVMERRSSMDRCACDDPSYLPSSVMKRAVEEFAKYGTTESMTARRDHNETSRGPSTQPFFDRFSANRVLLWLGFCFFINSSKNLVLGVRLLVIRHFYVRFFVRGLFW